MQFCIVTKLNSQEDDLCFKLLKVFNSSQLVFSLAFCKIYITCLKG